MAYIYPFRMASGTATMLVIDPINKRILNGVRSKKAWVYPSYNSLPGGFMEAKFTEEQGAKQEAARSFAMAELNIKLVADEFHEGEDLEACALRELWEELKARFEREQLHMFAVRSNSRTDTRAHVINACFWLEATPEQIDSIEAGDDLEDTNWLEFDDLLNAPLEMAFNHMEVAYQGLRDYCRFKVTENLIAEAVANGHEHVLAYLDVDAKLAKLEAQVANG